MRQKKIANRLSKGRPKRLTVEAKSAQRDYQFHICVWLALRKTTRQILDLLQDNFGITMAQQNIDGNYRYGKKWQKVISYLRVRYLNNISRIPIANEKYQLQALQEALETALTWHTKTVNQYGVVQEKKIGNVPSIIEEARKILQQATEKGQAVEKHTHYTNIVISTDEATERELIDLVLGRAHAGSFAGARK